MAAQPNIGGALSESSVIPFLVPRHKVWLTAAAWVPCSHTANIGERNTWMQSEFRSWQDSVTGQEPPKTVYTAYQARRQLNIVQSLVASGEWRRCSNEAKTRNPLKFAGVPQTNETISAASRPKFIILWGQVEEILFLTCFFGLSIHVLVMKI